MAIVNKVTAETIERLRGVIDFYMLRGILPVARKWPKKPKPPYTALQAEAMAVFSIAQSSKKRLSENILEAWRLLAVGKREAWYDTYTGLIMGYWQKNRSIALIALDYSFVEYETEFKVKWEVLQLYLDPNIPEVIAELESLIIKKEDITKMHDPIYFTLSNSEGQRHAAPYILFEVEEG